MLSSTLSESACDAQLHFLKLLRQCRAIQIGSFFPNYHFKSGERQMRRFAVTPLPNLAKLAILTVLLLPIESCGGPNIGQMLDDLQGKIASTGGLLGHTAGLAESQALDILALRVQELRSQWKDILTDGVNTLDTEQQKTIDNIRKGTANVNGVIDHTTHLEDLAVLDAGAILGRFGLGSGTEIRRIEPSALIHKRTGLYSYVVTLPLFGTGNKIKDIYICFAGSACKPVGDSHKIEGSGVDVFQYKNDSPPHSFRLDIPVDQLESAFDDWKLGRATLMIDIETPTTKWWKPWSAPIKQTLKLDTGLFPRYPLRYWFAEHPHHTEIDTDPAHIQVVNSPQTLIPGCGNSGCYWSYNVCATAPPGSQPVGPAFDPHDSFNGWGSFIGASTISSNLTCWTYQQHSHNQNRNVWFSAHYQPTKDVADNVYYVLKPLIVPPNRTSAEISTARLELASYNPLPGHFIRPQLQEVIKKMNEASSQMNNALQSALQVAGSTTANNQLANQPPPNGGPDPVANPKYYAPTGDTGPVPRPLEYGMTYLAPYHLGVNYEFVVQSFTGELITSTPTHNPGGPKSQLEVAPENGERLRIDTIAPWGNN
jgi:hypothetical protein